MSQSHFLNLTKTLFILMTLFIAETFSLGLDLRQASDDENSVLQDDNDRAIILTTAGVNLPSILGLNFTNLFPLLNLASAALLPVIGGLSLAAFVLSSIVAKDYKSYDSGYNGYASSYSEYSRYKSAF